jgi:holliday junction DNA helicase RuvA
MYEYLEGRLIEKTPTYAVVDCGVVGYHVFISLYTSEKLGNQKDCKLFTHLVVREDAHILFGFSDRTERAIFQQLISVSGVGASTARMILSHLNPEEVVSAISTGNVAALKGVKGIGEKSAQRIIVDLKGKLGSGSELPENFLVSNNKIMEEALRALVALGFNKTAGEKALDKAIKANPTEKTVEQLVKDALKFV